MTNVTCTTPDCANAGTAIDVDLTWTDDDGNTHQVGGVACGVCGQPIPVPELEDQP